MVAAVIVDGVRAPGGKRNGRLSGWHPADLSAEVLRALVVRNEIDPAVVDDVIMGCVSQVGDQALNIGRNAVLAAACPSRSRRRRSTASAGGSSQQALHFAAQGVMAGAYDVVIATGVGCMTRVPIGSSIGTNVGFPFGPGVLARYAPGGGLVTQGIAAEMVADRWDLSREDLDAYGARSQHRAAAANAEGRFESELIPVAVKDGEGNETGEILRTDEGIRPGTTIEALAAPKPVFKPDVGKVTAGNSSQITDGASAVLVTSEETALRLGLTPRARLVEFAVVGVDSVTMLTGPIPATTRVLERAGIALSDIDLVEINEAFASVVLAWAKEHHPDLDRVNVNGGAIASGHPLGASGARLMATLLCELERSGGRYGLQTMCEGGGLANATIIERLT
jgi:acetyl-CoA acyltransferase